MSLNPPRTVPHPSMASEVASTPPFCDRDSKSPLIYRLVPCSQRSRNPTESDEDETLWSRRRFKLQRGPSIVGDAGRYSSVLRFNVSSLPNLVEDIFSTLHRKTSSLLQMRVSTLTQSPTSLPLLSTCGPVTRTLSGSNEPGIFHHV